MFFLFFLPLSHNIYVSLCVYINVYFVFIHNDEKCFSCWIYWRKNIQIRVFLRQQLIQLHVSEKLKVDRCHKIWAEWKELRVTGYNLNRNAPFWVSPTEPLVYAEKMARHSLSVLPVINTNACCCFAVQLGLRKKRQYAALENCDVFYLLQMYQMKRQILN